MGNAWDDVFDDLDNAKPAEAWRPENAGDSIAGIVDAVGEFTNEYGTVPTVTLTQRDGSAMIVYGFSGALKKRLTDANLKPGDGVKVAFLGMGEMQYKGKKTPFKKFEIAVKRNAASALSDDVQMGGETMPEPKVKATASASKGDDGFGDEAF